MQTDPNSMLDTQTLKLVQGLIRLIVGRDLQDIAEADRSQVIEACVGLYLEFVDQFFASQPQRLRMQYKLSQTASYQSHAFEDLNIALAGANQALEEAIKAAYE